MISMLKGEVAHIGTKDLTLMVGGVGYHVYIPGMLQNLLHVGQEVLLYTTLISRDDSLDLYGFFDPRQKEMFSLLLNVSGVGPKTAMGILSQVDPGRFFDAVVSEDTGYLSSLPGIGKKSAQRIILELKEKILKQYQIQEKEYKTDPFDDAVSALVTLGYSEAKARQAVSNLAQSKNVSVEEIIKQALKALMK